MKAFLKILLWVALIAVVILVVMFISVRIGEFETFGDLIDYLVYQYQSGDGMLAIPGGIGPFLPFIGA